MFDQIIEYNFHLGPFDIHSRLLQWLLLQIQKTIQDPVRLFKKNVNNNDKGMRGLIMNGCSISYNFKIFLR